MTDNLGANKISQWLNTVVSKPDHLKLSPRNLHGKIKLTVPECSLSFIHVLWCHVPIHIKFKNKVKRTLSPKCNKIAYPSSCNLGNHCRKYVPKVLGARGSTWLWETLCPGHS